MTKDAMNQLAVTGTLRDLLIQQTASVAELEKICESIEFHRTSILAEAARNGKLEALRLVYELLDFTIRERNAISKLPKPSCRKGCAFCCNYKIDSSKEEAELALQYADENGIDIDVTRLEAQSRMTGDVEYMLSKDSRCVFLQDDKTCGIYPVRPLACRKFFVTTNPKFCDGKTYPRHGYQVIVDAVVEEIVSGLFSAYGNPDSFTAHLYKVIQDEEQHLAEQGEPSKIETNA